MNNIKHIHEVLFLFEELERFENEEHLFKIIKERLGEDVKFVSCSNEPFGLNGVVEFLTQRNKIMQNLDGSLVLHPQMKMCNGHEHHH